MDRSKWDTHDWRDWMYKQTDDAIVTELVCQHREIAALRSLVGEMARIIFKLTLGRAEIIHRPEVWTIMGGDDV